jgi:hypothetical protein
MSKKPAPPTTPQTGTSGTSARAAPINGGVETFDGVNIPWTGGSRQATSARSEPASIKPIAHVTSNQRAKLRRTVKKVLERRIASKLQKKF